MATIHKLTKDGATIFPATITDAVVHPQTGKTLTSMMKDYNVSELFPTEGIDGGNKYNLALAIQVLGTHLSAAQKTGGIKLTFISSVSPYPEEEYYLGKSSWSTTAADWDQRFEVGDVVADPSGSWTPSTAEAYIDSQIATLSSNIASETIARQNGDNNLRTQLQSEMATRADQDANLNALINAGIREGGGVQFDTVPTQNSANGITSGGMYSTLKDSNVGFVDDEPIAGSDNLVNSGGVYNKLFINKITITSVYAQQKGYTSIFDLPRNKIYVIGNDIPKSFGLPFGNLYATLLVYFPDTNPGKGFTVYEYSARVSGKMVRYTAFTFHDDQELSWNKVELDIDYNNIVSGYSIDINADYIQQHPDQDTFLKLPKNKIYVINGNVPDSFGLPHNGCWGTLEIVSPNIANQSNTGFRICTLCLQKNSTNFEYWWAFTSVGQAASDVVWYKVPNINEIINSNQIVSSLRVNLSLDYIQQRGYTNVFDLPRNKIYYVDPTLPLSFGLPISGYYGALFVYYPATTSNIGGTVYEFTTKRNNNSLRRFIAYSWIDQTELDWHEVGFDIDSRENLVQYYTEEIGSEYIQQHPEQDTFLKLPINKIYLIKNSVPSSFGLPKSVWGTLEIISPYLVNPNSGFRICKYICQINERDFEYYWCLTSQNQIASDVKWFKIQNHKTKVSKLRNLGITTTRIILLGDSIVDGYGSSDHNGGYSGPGPIIPITDWEWHRNTGHKCWGNMFVDYITSTYSNAVCVNNGIGAFRTNQVYNNLGTLAYDDDGNLADVIILAIGTNNIGSSNKTADVTNYLKDIAQWCFDRDIELILLTNSPVRGYQNAEYAIQSAILKAAEDFGINHINVLSEVIYYLDDHNLTKDDFLHDALHPNDLGYEIMFKIIRKELQV